MCGPREILLEHFLICGFPYPQYPACFPLPEGNGGFRTPGTPSSLHMLRFFFISGTRVGLPYWFLNVPYQAFRLGRDTNLTGKSLRTYDRQTNCYHQFHPVLKEHWMHVRNIHLTR